MPGRKWYWLAGAIAVVGIGAFIFLMVSRLGGVDDKLSQMLAPGKVEMDLAEPGTYTIFHEHESVFQERYYSSAEVVSGLAIRVVSVVSGAPVKVEAPDTNANYTLEGRAGVSILEFEIARPGPYRISAAYADGRRKPQIVLAIGHDFVGDLLVTVLGALAIMFASLGGAGAIIAVTAIKRDKAIRRSKRK